MDECKPLVNGVRAAKPPPMSDELAYWMSEAQWVSLQGLEEMAAFKVGRSRLTPSATRVESESIS